MAQASPELKADFSTRADRCGVKETPADQVPLIETASNSGVSDGGGIVTIPVYWHIITTATGGGNVSARVADQMQVLNAAYAASKFEFNLVNVEVIPNNGWFFAAAESAEEIAMKNALRKGGPATTVWFCGGPRCQVPVWPANQTTNRTAY